MAPSLAHDSRGDQLASTGGPGWFPDPRMESALSDLRAGTGRYQEGNNAATFERTWEERPRAAGDTFTQPVR